MSRRDTAVGVDDPPAVELRFGGWHNGDNHKPGRGWFFVCRCGAIGLGQLLPQSALSQWKKHARRCDSLTELERR